VKLLNDSHHMVRSEAAKAVGEFGVAAKDAIPDLIKLVNDVQGQNWYIRQAALSALQEMPLEGTVEQAVLRAGLNDPSSIVRGNAIKKAFGSKDPASAKMYKDEMIDQVFDAPHGMFTRHTRLEMADRIIAQLSKDDIRPSLPRFFEALRLPGGDEIEGCIAVLESFGDEVRPKLEVLAKDENPIVRYNAYKVLYKLRLRDASKPERIEFLQNDINSGNSIRAEAAQKLLDELNGVKSKAPAMVGEVAGGGGNGGGDGSGGDGQKEGEDE
jgi:HEAT repeat protein